MNELFKMKWEFQLGRVRNLSDYPSKYQDQRNNLQL